MNLYLRYFDKEALVATADEAIDFLKGIGEIDVTPVLETDIRDYAKSDVFYPKRYKVRPRIYFIIIKTEAATMQDFKEKKALRATDGEGQNAHGRGFSPQLSKLNEEREGWYEGVMDFKRVQLVPVTGKFQYRDTHYVARLKAHSGIDCYNRIVENLRGRVDSRSQFPSVKGKNFKCTFLGLAKQQ